jgi:transcriptional regulator with PAS, ATPase and Fis domain
MVGQGPAMQRLYHLVQRAAPSEGRVLITGENGTGKELVARALHANSRRASGPFVRVNCAAVPHELIESELFGHEKGAFTGALALRRGKFELASGGTLFLDEVGELTPQLQVKLLRAIQERVVYRVGDSKPEKCDIRIVAATNRSLDEMIKTGEFREDLYYRLNVVNLWLPPLRERGDDVIEIARHLITKYGESGHYELTAETHRALLHYPWPGNVRELENCVQAALTFAVAPRIDFEDLPTAVRSRTRGSDVNGADSDPESLEKVEIEHILRVLDAVGGNKAAAARVLKIDRTTLYRKLERASTRGIAASRDRNV